MKTIQENRPVSEKGYSTVDHLQTINQLIEKCNEFKGPLCIGYIDYEKAFDAIEHEVQGFEINRYKRNLYYYCRTTARAHVDNPVSTEKKKKKY